LTEGHRRAVDSRANFIRGDLADRAHVEVALSNTRPDAVMHFAANALVGESMRDPSKYFRNNICNGLNLLDAMIAARVQRIVFSSTCAIFGLPERLPIDEMTPAWPINPYGESKLAFEKILQWYDRIHGLKFVSLRYFNAAGATENFGEDHRQETHLIPNVLKVALGEKSNVEIYGTDYETPDGTCVRDYIHIVDLARAHMLALGPANSAFYNLGTGGGSSVREVIAACAKITGRKIAIIEKPRRPGDPPRLIASSEKIKKELAWRPQFQSLEAIIESAWKWHEKFPRGYED
jgi:UDP-glucose 4-epimerase